MKDLKKQIKKLSEAEKIILVENIWDSIADKHYSELSAVQKKELDLRLELIKSGKATFESLNDIKRKFRNVK